MAASSIRSILRSETGGVCHAFGSVHPENPDAGPAPVGRHHADDAVDRPANIWQVVTRDRVAAALFLSFRLALLAALFNLVFGVLLAWVLSRYEFPGRRLVDAAVDLPFALPTAVAGIALTALYAPNGVFGQFAAQFGLRIAYTQWGILLALIFVGLPFVTRTVQPVIAEIDREVEEASATLGASRLHTVVHVILPMLAPAALTGFALALARAVGEYGSVIFIAGNIPMKTEIAPLLIVIQLEEFNYQAAGAIGIAMLLISFGMLLVINLIQILSRRRMGHV
jgi:sulfate transport system permease protein